MNEERLVELEIKVSHHELAIEGLQQTIFEYGLLIQSLEKQVKTLTDRFEALGGGSNDTGPANVKPPHY